MLPPRPRWRSSAVTGADSGTVGVVAFSTISADAGIDTGTADVDAVDCASAGSTVGSFDPPSVMPTTKSCE
ncbi:hypothetical protein BYT27DRAFT_7184171 [Phlegmacium glaucopus]|nr:hypothetical protein BYT27DRAFT_7184171 [Phlegmacium glaucopus]